MARVASLERERYWRGLIADQKMGGLSISAFCRDRGVSEASFFNWRRRLDERTEAKPANKFVAIDVSAAGNSAHGFEVALPNGRRVFVPPQFCADSLCELIGVLEKASC